jgi:extracellular matrix protein 14
MMMWHFLDSLSFLSALFLALSFAPLFAFAVPNDNPFPNGGYQVPAKHQPYRLRSVFPQLTWLRDTAIEKVFGVPPKSTKSKGDRSSSLSRPSSSQLPATLLAKYGGDVVLRFNISTSEEEAALSEAADTLFLDVWEFADNWADIRLREDDVCTGVTYSMMLYANDAMTGSFAPWTTTKVIA